MNYIYNANKKHDEKYQDRVWTTPPMKNATSLVRPNPGTVAVICINW